jgi:microcystin-dependent protein
MIRFKLIFWIWTLLVFTNTIAGQVGVNILSPHPSAALQVESPAGIQRGLLTPSMSTINRISINTGTNLAADGLIVYDINHKMHYYYQANLNRWVSMSPLLLSTPTSSSALIPSGVITTPSSTAVFSLGVNTQNPAHALHVVGNSAVSGNAIIGGNATVTGTLVANTISVNGFAPNPLVPTGAIVLWSGTLIPMGWGLCDGTIYAGFPSPDLRGRFIVGVDNAPNTQIIFSGQYLVYPNGNASPSTAPSDGTTLNYGQIGNKGGENGHTLVLAESPSHTHNVSATITNGPFLQYSLMAPNGNFAFVPTGIVATPSISISETSKGGNQIHENRPPYYVLAYIIKLPY